MQNSENKKVSIGLIGGVEKRAIIISPYTDRWAQEYEHHRKLIKSVLGDLALKIEHIGSTSVKDLPAKPIIDILVVVRDPSNEDAYIPALENIGYELRVRQPEFDGHRMLRTIDKDVHVHFFPPYSDEIERYLLFRDALRCNPDMRNRYAELKMELSKIEWNDMNEYAEAKSAFIEGIISQVGKFMD